MSGSDGTFEAFDASDYAALLSSSRACWRGPWIPPNGSPESTPLEWLRRLGAARPAMQGHISRVLCELLLETETGLPFAASTILAQADWDHREVVERFAMQKWSVLGGLDSTVFRDSSRLRDLTQILVASPSRTRISGELAALFAGVTSEADGLPGSLLLAGVLGFEQLSATLAGSARAPFEKLLMSVLSWGDGVYEKAVFTHFGEGSDDFRARVANCVKRELEKASRRAAIGAEDVDLPDRLRERLANTAGTHEERWRTIASLLGVDALPFR